MKSDNIALVFIIGAIISLIFIGGLLFLIIYGIIKKKKGFWITGTLIAGIWLVAYLFMYFSRYNAAADAKQEAQEQLNKR